MSKSIPVAVAMSFMLGASAFGQPGFATPEGIQSLGLTPIAGDIPVYRVANVSTAEATDLQTIMTECVAKYRSALRSMPKVELAILDSVSWTRVSQVPYGIPHHNALTSPVVVLVPATAARLFAGGAAGVSADKLDRFFHLLALHELSHVIMFGVIGVDRTSAFDYGHFPGWYYEFAANYISLSCLSSRPAEALLLRGTEASIRALPRPSFTNLDDFPKVLTMRNADGAPYLFTSVGSAHFAWYQRLMGEAAGRTAQLGMDFVPLLREQWTRHDSVTTSDIVRDFSKSSPGFSEWLKSFYAIK